MPFPGTRVIHPAFQAHHAPVAEGGMTATCALFDPAIAGEDVFDPATGQTTTVPPAPVWTGVSRVQNLSDRAGTTDAAGEQVNQPPYLVAVPADVPAVDEGWPVEITECAEDVQLVGRRFVVRQVIYASTRLQRDLLCDDE